MKLSIPVLLSTLILLSACSDVREAKLNYDYRTECMGSYTVRCTDVKIRLMILQAQTQKAELVAHEAEAAREIGQANYRQMLTLFDQKIEHLKKERPNILLRWFRGEDEYPFEVDDGWRINAKIAALGERALRPAQPPAIQPQSNDIDQMTSTDNTALMQDQLKAALTGPLQTADQVNAETMPGHE
ncbi:hypothetical protein [Alkanindiges illinoisensis]|uniref:hypothetical protein n=1 Tax=Alkanindiges illinoisensis TaxID=197183 RepID=UPI00047E0B44|nr:hypothetical protein [Alkanindiges illinoisensis]